MESRIDIIRNNFKRDLQLLLSEDKSTKLVINDIVQPLKEHKISIKPKAKELPPLMMKKINRFKEESKKNNLKRVQKPFEYHGNIDEYEKELENRFKTNEKDIE
jgi:hypothetical protein